MPSAAEKVMDLIFGRWRSQILYAGVELGVFDRLDKAKAKTPEILAQELGVDAALLYRLLRAQATIGLLTEGSSRGFTLTDAGQLLCVDHPQSLKSMARLEEGPQHYALWKHLPPMVRDGRQNAFMREFGVMAFEHARRDPDYAERFGHAMTSYSGVQSAMALEALRSCDLLRVKTFCDVAGGYGHLMCSLLQAHPHLSGTVLDLPEVVANKDARWASRLGLENRCRYVAGDMFKQVPIADAYSLKMILHDWNDDECVEILSAVKKAANSRARVFIIEHLIPGPDEPHFAKLFDVHMMCWGTGRERTEAQYASLLEAAGWKKAACYYPSGRLIGVVEGVSGMS